jgi:hypothetical protein
MRLSKTNRCYAKTDASFDTIRYDQDEGILRSIVLAVALFLLQPFVPSRYHLSHFHNVFQPCSTMALPARGTHFTFAYPVAFVIAR